MTDQDLTEESIADEEDGETAELLMYQQGVAIIGDGPTGLSAALFLAKNGVKNVRVFGENETYLHDAHLYNYLGIDSIDGSEFADTARDQCRSFGADLYTTLVETVEPKHGGFYIKTSGGEHYGAKYVVIAEGDGRGISKELGLEFEDLDGTSVVKTDKYGRTSIENVYAGGWTARNNKIQAIISAGDGAAIALDILSKEHDRQFHDFDVPGE